MSAYRPGSEEVLSGTGKRHVDVAARRVPRQVVGHERRNACWRRVGGIDRNGGCPDAPS
jgi:hypothetical protein